jgi:hypothetical protein
MAARHRDPRGERHTSKIRDDERQRTARWTADTPTTFEPLPESAAAIAERHESDAAQRIGRITPRLGYDRSEGKARDRDEQDEKQCAATGRGRKAKHAACMVRDRKEAPLSLTPLRQSLELSDHHRQIAAVSAR